jgi:hypothetical protein
MKQVLLIISLLTIVMGEMSGQVDVFLKVNHLLGEEEFQMGQEAKNNLNQKFILSRLQYYISEVTLFHDGGKETTSSFHVLVNADERREYELGNLNVQEVESIRFGLGVDPAFNNEDPSVLPWDHPLAPKNPSMHWGWIGGYRFIAFEGKGGPNLDQDINLHGLGNDNYFYIDLPVKASAQGGRLVIEVIADYTRALENLDVDQGLIEHGDFGAAKDILENMRDYVFSAARTTSVSSATDLDLVIFPNPVMDYMELRGLGGTYHMIVRDVAGREQLNLSDQVEGSTINVSGLSNGLYLLEIRHSEGSMTRPFIKL